MTWVDGFAEERLFSVNQRPYSAEERASDPGYGDRWGGKWTYAPAGMATIAELVTTNVWSPIVWSSPRRSKDDFVESAWCGLDFETPDYTLDDAIEQWSSTVCVIGVTANHRVPKKTRDLGVVALDRFRIVTPWEEPIKDLDHYEQNMRFLVEQFGADGTCIGGAQMFYPCVDVVFSSVDGFLQDVRQFARPRIVDSIEAIEARRSRFGRALPRWVHQFLHDGKVPDFNKFCDSRAWTIWGVAKTLAELGRSFEEARSMIKASPFDRTQFSERELELKVAGGFRSFRDRVKKLERKKANG